MSSRSNTKSEGLSFSSSILDAIPNFTLAVVFRRWKRGGMAASLREPRAPEPLQGCSLAFSSFQLLVQLFQALLHLTQSLPAFPVVCVCMAHLPASRRAPQLLSSFQPMQLHHSYILQDKGLPRPQGSHTFQQLKLSAFSFCGSKLVSAV